MKTFRCAKCGKTKPLSLFPEGRSTWCLACTKEDSAARRHVGVQRWSHGASAYKNHGCRCRVCKDAWNSYVKARYAERKHRPVPETLVSWWLDAPTAGLTAFVESTQLPRMRVSRFGAINGKPISTDELSR